MKTLSWIGRHKVWSFLIVAFISMVVVSIFAPSVDSVIYGEMWGVLFWLYLLIIWLYSVVKKRMRGSRHA